MSLSVFVSELSRPSLGWLIEKLAISVFFVVEAGLAGDELAVTASLGGGASSTDDFKQVHNIPEGIDLDQLSSSFSADGVLVIKAPRKK